MALYYVIAAMNTVAQLMGYKFSRFAWHMHDLIIGHLLFTVLFLLAALQFPSTVQVRGGSSRRVLSHVEGLLFRRLSHVPIPCVTLLLIPLTQNVAIGLSEETILLGCKLLAIQFNPRLFVPW